MTRPLPKAGDTINCDPNRDDPECPWRWTNVNRKSGKVVKVFKDGDYTLIVYRVWSRRRGWRYFIENQMWWEISTQWAIGPLPKAPKETDR